MKASGRGDFEFVFVSSDRDEKAFGEYHAEMPWLALPFEKRAEKEALSSLFKVGGIPTLVTVDADTGKVINANARGSAAGDKAGAEFPWPVKPFSELSESVDCNGSDINETPSVVVVCDNGTAAEMDACRAAVAAAARAHDEAAKAAWAGEPSLLFYSATASEGAVVKVKELCRIKEDEQGITFVLLDIPDEGGFYSRPAGPGEVTAASIDAFVAEYKAKALPRQQLGSN
jgi:hypothetical protein